MSPSNLTIQASLAFQLIDSNNIKTDLSAVIQLLRHIKQTGNLRMAAKHCGFSYRKAWDLLKSFEKLLKQALVEMHRGRGSQLTEFSEGLLTLLQHQQDALDESFRHSNKQINQWLNQQTFEPQGIHMIASDSEILNRMHQSAPDLFQLQVTGSIQALTAYRDKKNHVAGFHLPKGQLGQAILNGFIPFLTETDQFIILEHRQQGIISHPDLPVYSIGQIVEQQLNFVNRQIGSGTRTLLDQILKSNRVSHQQISGYHHEQHTHLAVAGLIASRQADAGLGVYQVAKRLGLHFSRLCDENYFLVFPENFFQLKDRSALLNKLNINDENELLSYAQFLSLCQNTPPSI